MWEDSLAKALRRKGKNHRRIFGPSRSGLDVRLLLKAVHNANDAVFDQLFSKIDEQTQPLVGQPEIRQQLFLVNRRQALHRFELHNHLAFHDQIGFEANLQLHAFVYDWDRLFVREILFYVTCTRTTPKPTSHAGRSRRIGQPWKHGSLMVAWFGSSAPAMRRC